MCVTVTSPLCDAPSHISGSSFTLKDRHSFIEEASSWPVSVFKYVCTFHIYSNQDMVQLKIIFFSRTNRVHLLDVKNQGQT